MLGALAAPAQAEPRQVLGYAGALGEWELTATVNETTTHLWSKEFSGPLTMSTSRTPRLASCQAEVSAAIPEPAIRMLVCSVSDGSGSSRKSRSWWLTKRSRSRSRSRSREYSEEDDDENASR